MADGAYETRHQPLARQGGRDWSPSHLSKSAYAIKRRPPTGSTGSTGNAAFDKINDSVSSVDRYSDERAEARRQTLKS